jgi:hypothetical protein
MTDRSRTPEPDPAEGEAIGARIRALTGDVEAPPALRARIEAERAKADVARSRRRFSIPALPAAAAGAVAAVAVALLLVLSGGGSGAGPSVADAAVLALARPTAPAPAVNASDRHLIDAHIAGITFPNYGYQWPRWQTSGQRTDTISGRAATTVTYRGPRGDVGYTIVDGKPLPEPKGVRHVTSNGMRFAVLSKGDATVVTWRRAGHTCVLAGRGKGVETQLVAFASWA